MSPWRQWAARAFYGTELHQILINRPVSHLIIVGKAKNTYSIVTLREANDRGNYLHLLVAIVISTGFGESFECVVVSDAVDGHTPVFRHAPPSMFVCSDAS
jgi:nicotinamidase-related amidase